MKFSIAERTLSLNDSLDLHWSQKTKLRNRYQLLLLSLYRKKHSCKMKIHICRSYRSIPLDPDNLRGGAKTLVDAMKRNEIIVDDNEEWALITYGQIKSSIPYTEITIEEL